MYQLDLLIQGFPGKSVCHGTLGWSTIALLRSETRAALIDVGTFGARTLLEQQLQARGVAPEAITDVILTHAHYDHSVNFTLFPRATVWIGAVELDWAAAEPPGFNPLPELYVTALATESRVRRLAAGEVFMPGLKALAAPGHTPGSLIFHLTEAETPVIFTGDAAKNRAELLSRRVDMSMDEAASRASIDMIWDLWRSQPGTLLVPGHDVPMRLDADGQPAYAGPRQAGIYAWFGEDLSAVTHIDFVKE